MWQLCFQLTFHALAISLSLTFTAVRHGVIKGAV